MFGFINHINDREELLEQIKKQTKLGWWGFFLKKMFNNGMSYNKGENVKEKKALQLITPQQSLFANVRNNYKDVCLTLLRTVYDEMPENHLDLAIGLKDVSACINLGDIYVTERDTDIFKGDEGFLNRILKRRERQFDIYIPPYINNKQMEELLKTMKNRTDFERWFKKDDSINLSHYISKDNIQRVSGDEALEYMVRELPAWVKDGIPVKSNEKIIIDTFREAADINQGQNAPFVERVDTEPVVANRDNSMQGNSSKTISNDYTTPGEADSPR